MAVYAIGDVQGCHDELQRLIELIRFDPSQDQIWFTGDLVNRGPKSLETLRTIRSLGHSARSVLGNHDLHLLAVAEGVAKPKRQDTLNDILMAVDREDLLAWLRTLPLIHHDFGFYLIHAGLPPQWTIDEALKRAGEVETTLRGNHYRSFLQQMYGNTPDLWQDQLEGFERLRFITNCLTRLRFCTPSGRICLSEKGAPEKTPGLIPWFSHPERKSRNTSVIFGHWSTLGFHQAHNATCLDTGCLWGGTLTAMRLDGTSTCFSVHSGAGPYQNPEQA